MSYISSINTSFFHIPKTGGNSVTTLLAKLNLQSFNIGHTLFKEVYNNSISAPDWPSNYRDIILNSYKVSVVRHPYDRMRSYYCYLKKYEKSAGAKIKHFDDFLFNKDNLISNERAMWSQTKYLFHQNKNQMDQIIKFENFSFELSKLFKDKGLDIDFTKSHTLKTNSKKTVVLTELQKEHIYKTHKEDFINFNFEQ